MNSEHLTNKQTIIQGIVDTHRDLGEALGG
jgi:hypothetical protein